MNRDDIEARAAVLERLSAPGAALDSEAPTATTNNRQFYYGRGRPTPERIETHEQLLAAYRAQYPDAAAGGHAIVMAGPSGAGKSRALEQTIIGRTGIPAEQWLVLDADQMKDLLLDQAQRDGTYEHLILEQLRALPGGPVLPRELAALVHEESSALIKQLQRQSIRDGLNVVIDGTLANRHKADQLFEQLQDAGYTVHVASINVTQAQSLERARDRWEHGNDLATLPADHRDHDPLGGRLVPPAFVATLYDGADREASRCETNATAIAYDHDHVIQLIRLDGVTGQTRGDYRREKSGGPLLDCEHWKAHQTRAIDFPARPTTPTPAHAHDHDSDSDSGRGGG